MEKPIKPERYIFLSTAIAGIGVAVFIGLWLWDVMPLSLYIQGKAPLGQTAYVTMRGLGLLALCMLWLQLMLGVMTPLLLTDSGLQSSVRRFHQRLGIFTLLLLFSHPLFFLLGTYLRTMEWQLKLLLPSFTNGYYRGVISIGVLALYLLVLGVMAAVLRRFQPFRRVWRTLHRVNGVVFVLACLHCMLIGSETRNLIVYLWLGLAGAVALRALLLRRRTATES